MTDEIKVVRAAVENLLSLLGQARPFDRLCRPLHRDVFFALAFALVDLSDLSPARTRTGLVLADASSQLLLVLGVVNDRARCIAWIGDALMTDLTAIEIEIMPRAVMPAWGIGPEHNVTVLSQSGERRMLRRLLGEMGLEVVQ